MSVVAEILTSAGVVNSMRRFGQVTLPQIRSLFEAEFVNFVRYDVRRGAQWKGAKLQVEGASWSPEIQAVYDRMLCESDPILSLMREGVHSQNYNTIRLSQYFKRTQNPRFFDFLSDLKAVNVLTIVISSEDSIRGSFTIGRSRSRGDFSDQEADLARIISTGLNMAYRGILDRQALTARAIALELAQDSLQDVVAIMTGGVIAYRNTALCDRHHLEDRDLDEALSAQRAGDSVGGITRLQEKGILLQAYNVERDNRRFTVLTLRHLKQRAIFQLENRLLSARERQVIRMVCQGLSVGAVAQGLSISPWTVKNHLSNIYEKTGVNSRIGLIHLFDQR
jgi:DNA-binding CsgD family transcriptional regulator